MAGAAESGSNGPSRVYSGTACTYVQSTHSSEYSSLGFDTAVILLLIGWRRALLFTVVSVVVVAGWPSFGRLNDTRLNGARGEFN